MTTAREALDRLRDGNHRFVGAAGTLASRATPDRRAVLADGQQPFAAVLGCADSRVPPEIVFDQGLGDLFVVRVAGNLAAPTQVGSLEFAVEHFGTRLVVVLGHSRCGAVSSALEATRDAGASLTPDLRAIIDGVQPSIEAALSNGVNLETEEIIRRAVELNVCAATSHLRHRSEPLARLIRDDGLAVVGAVYDVATGLVALVDEGVKD